MTKRLHLKRSGRMLLLFNAVVAPLWETPEGELVTSLRRSRLPDLEHEMVEVDAINGEPRALLTCDALGFLEVMIVVVYESLTALP